MNSVEVAAEFFEGLKISLSVDAAELLFVLLRATATGFGASDTEPAGHLTFHTSVAKLREEAVHANLEKPWLAAELMLAALLLQSMGAEMAIRYYQRVHSAIHPPS